MKVEACRGKSTRYHDATVLSLTVNDISFLFGTRTRRNTLEKGANALIWNETSQAHVVLSVVAVC